LSGRAQGGFLQVRGPGCCRVFCFFSKRKKERKKKERKEGRKEGRKKKEKARGLFSLGQTCHIGCATQGFSRLLGTIKSCFKGHFLNFVCT
jgi:hypothetical protein